MSLRQLGRVFAEWSADGQPLVLASVYETRGSTYSKAGACMLITGEGIFQGMLSGGCLEGDLAERAKQVSLTRVAQTVTYDLGQNDEELWGLGVGCDGLMRIFLQPITADDDYEPFTSMQRAWEGSQTQAAVTVIQSEHERLLPGMSLVAADDAVVWSSIPDPFHGELLSASRDALHRGDSATVSIGSGDKEAQVLIRVLRPIPRVLVLGAGLDAEPVVRFVAELGWRACISDHRPAYIESGDFSLADAVQCVDAIDVSTTFDLDQFDAVIIMSHHLVTDEIYLRQIAVSRIPYVGLLGPPNRRERLLDSLGDNGAALAGRLHGPAGIDIKASGPASIAMSIVAQMHLHLMR